MIRNVFKETFFKGMLKTVRGNMIINSREEIQPFHKMNWALE